MKTLRDRTSALLLGIALCGLASLAAAAPTVSLTSPVANTQYLAPATITLIATNVTASPGTTISKIEFYQGTTLLGTDTTASPWSVTWSNAPAGTYSLTAKATDSAGGVTTSAPVSLTVNATNAPPIVTLANSNNISYLAPATIGLTANASGVEANTPVTLVEFYQGTTLIGSDTTSPFSVNWSPVAGTYSVTAKATDSAGGVTTSAPRTITVNASNTLPTVSLTAPAANASYTLPATLTLSASASGVELNTPITSVEFYQGTTRVGTATASPFSVTWTPTAAGTYSLTAKAIDSAGGVTTSAPRTVTIQPSAAAQVYYLHTDHLNTPRLVTDEANTVIWRATPVSEPFGMGPPEEDPDQNGTPFVLNLRFPGQVFDKESNLSYNYFRDYNPQTGRYIQSDPIGLQGGINTYGYVGGNPLSKVDPQGLVAWSGTMGGFAVVDGVGAGFFGFDLTSECKCGRKLRIKGYASTVAGGLGFKYTGSGSAASFHDSNPCPEGDVANGFAFMTAATASPGAGGSWSKTKLGGLMSDPPRLSGPTYGVDISVGVYAGASVITSVEVIPCDECSAK